MPSPKPILEPPGHFDPWSLVEWVETTMLLEQVDEWTRSGIETSFPMSARPDPTELDEVLSEVERRSKVAPERYPFREENGIINRAQGVDLRVYEFLTLLSIKGAPYRKKSQWNKVNPLFDLLVREAAITYLGRPYARGVRFGWPTRDNRPTKLVKAMPWLARKVGLDIVSLDYVPDEGKDAGVDVVVWRPFAAGGSGFSCILIQDTLAMDFTRKPGDIALNRWKLIILFGSDPPVGLGVPFAVATDSGEWQEVAFRAQLIFDRLRVCEELDDVDLSGFPEWEMIARWNETQRAAVVKQLSKPAPKADRRRKRTKKPART